MTGQASSIATYTVAELAKRLGGELRGLGAASVSGVNSIEAAQASDITFITTESFLDQFASSKAGAAVVTRKLESRLTDVDGARPMILVADAEIASLRLLELFHQPERVPELGVHPSAVVDPTAKLGKGVRVGPHVSIDANAVIGDAVVLHAGVRIYEAVEIGAGSVLHANTVIRHRCKIGRGVIMHQTVSIGADGFGYRPDPSGAGLLKMPHLGNVIIEDGVEIGANSCVDRAKFGSTVVGAGTKVDNLVQIAHNCTIGRCCVIAGCTGLSGSVKIGDGAQIGGGVGITDHVSVGPGAKIGARSFVMRDVPAGAVYLGHPADESQSTLRQWASVRKLPELLRRLSKLLDASEQRVRRPQRES